MFRDMERRKSIGDEDECANPPGLLDGSEHRGYSTTSPFTLSSSSSSTTTYTSRCLTNSRRQFEHVYEFVDGGKCGSGSSASVFQVHRRSDGRKFACKISDCNDKETLLRALNEVEVMKTLHISGGCGPSGHIATFRDAFVRRTAAGTYHVYLVTDLMRGSDLSAALKHRGSYAEGDARAVMKQLLQALVCLHDARVTHRDVKLNNILLPSELEPTNIKLSDFDYSAQGTSSKPTMDKRCGSPMYIAPEVLDRDGFYGNKVDVWSSGVVLFQLLSGYPPFGEGSVSEVLRAIRLREPNMHDPVWELISAEARDFVRKLLEKDPHERMSAREALLHPWMARSEK